MIIIKNIESIFWKKIINILINIDKYCNILKILINIEILVNIGKFYVQFYCGGFRKYIDQYFNKY